MDLIARCAEPERTGFEASVARIRAAYDEVSAIYQTRKGENRNIPLK